MSSSTTILNGGVEVTSSASTYTIDVSNTGNSNANVVLRAGGNPVLTASSTGVSLVQAPLSVSSGGTGLIALPGPAPTSSYVATDANGKVQLVNEINQVTTLNYTGSVIQVTINGVAQSNVSGSTYSMTAASTGDFKVLSTSAAFTIKLPATNTLPYLNERFNILNTSSTGTVTVNTSASNLVQAVAPGALGLFLNTTKSGTGLSTDWQVVYTTSTAGAGTVTQVTASDTGLSNFLNLSQTSNEFMTPNIDLAFGSAPLGIPNGGTGQNTNVITPAANEIPSWDGNLALTASQIDFLPLYLNSAGTSGSHVVTTMTPASGRIVLVNAIFQDILLPDTMQTLPNGNTMLGYQVEIYNSSSGNSTTVSVHGTTTPLTVPASGTQTFGYFLISTSASMATQDPTQSGFGPGNTSVPVGAKIRFTCIDTTQNTVGAWIWEWIPVNDYTNANRRTDVLAGFTNNATLVADYFGNAGCNNTRYITQGYSSGSYQWGANSGGAIFSSNGGAAGSTLTPTSGWLSIDFTFPKYINLTPTASTFFQVVLPFCVGLNVGSSAQTNQCYTGNEFVITNTGTTPLVIYLFEYAGTTPTTFPVTNTALTSGQGTNTLVPIQPTTTFVTIPAAAPLISGTSGTGRFYSATFKAIAATSGPHQSNTWQVTPNWTMNMSKFGSIWANSSTLNYSSLSSTSVTMTAQYAEELELTPSASQTVTLPNATTCQLGQFWRFYCNTTQQITIQNGAGTPVTICTVPAVTPELIVRVTCTSTTGAGGSWTYEFENLNALTTSLVNQTPNFYNTTPGTTTYITGAYVNLINTPGQVSSTHITSKTDVNAQFGINTYDVSVSGSGPYTWKMDLYTGTNAIFKGNAQPQAVMVTCFQGSISGNSYNVQTVPGTIAANGTFITFTLNFQPANQVGVGNANDTWYMNFSYQSANFV